MRKPRWCAAARGRTLPMLALSSLLLTGCSSIHFGDVGLGVGSLKTVWTVGSCHRLDQYVETDKLYDSDTSPSVPCTTAHQSETFAVVPINGAAAEQRERPSVNWLAQQFAADCTTQLLARHLGQDAQDALRNIVVFPVVPSAAEWRGGTRRLRCDALIGPRGLDAVASISQGLKGILRTPAGARFRTCRLGYTDVSCDSLHTAELVYPDVPFNQSELARGHGYAIGKVTVACKREVASYVGAPLAERPDLVAEPEAPGDYPYPDSKVGFCWAATQSGAMVVGSVRRAGPLRTAP
jgi:putative regulator of septum formation